MSFARKALTAFLIIFQLSGLAQAGTITYYHTDLLGSPVLESNAAGAITRSVEYRPYGKGELDRPGSGPGFTGHLNDVGSGLTYMQARYYDPEIARFLSVDPIPVNVGNAFSFNRFAYANNNPYKYVDPDGQFAFLVVPAFYALTALAGAATVSSLMKGGGRQLDTDSGFGSGLSPITQISDVPSSTSYHNESSKGDREGSAFPDRELPRDRNGNPVRDPEAEGAHTQLGQKDGRRGKYDQGREWDASGNPVKDIDFTDHGRPGNHTNPHEHPYLPNPTGGTPQHGPARPLQN